MPTSTVFTDDLTATLLLSCATFLLAMLLTPIYTYFAYKHKWWKLSRTHSTDGKKLEVISKLRVKRTVPLMAGLVTIFAATIITLLFNLERAQTWLPLAALVGGGLVGLLDDIINVRGAGGKVAGLKPITKLTMVTIVASVASWFFYYKLGYHTILVPFAGDFDLGWLLIPFSILVIVSTSNAVNITDGVDGLAGGLLISAYGSFGVIALLQGNIGIAGFCMTIVGALLSYVWFNIPPARFFMGDVGSFSLGTSLGVVAMLTDTILLLPLIGLIFVIEAGSVVLQVTSKKIFKRKIFIASPIHHHFEAKGWPRTKITMRFWVIGQVCAVLGVVVAIVGGYIK